MAQFKANSLGEIDDRVRLTLGGQEVLIAESYEVRTSLTQQPSAWTIRLGHGDVAAKLLKKFQPNTPFELRIGDVLQQTGTLDSPAAESSSSGTTITLSGRDSLAPLHDDHIDSDRTFHDDTYVSLAKKQLEAVGLGDRTIHTTNRANRKIRSGVDISELGAHRTVEQILTNAAVPPGGSGIVHSTIQAHLNERRYEFLLRYLQVAGLFFWAAADGNFVLAEPNTKQKPMSSIVRRIGQSRRETNVVSGSVQNDTTHRYARYEVYGRGAGGKNGHVKALGEFVDDEMVAIGFKKRKIWRSQNARTKEQADFLARRMCAEDRRNGSQIRYTVAGHTTPFTGGERAVWTIDTIVTIDDELFGIKDDFYLTECTYRRSTSGTTTDLVFQRIEDQVWGPQEF